MSIEQAQRELTQAFVIELVKLHAKMDWPRYKTSNITLTVDFSQEEVKTKLTFIHDYGNSVEHAELGPLMDEVYRRLGFKDKADTKIQQAGQALRALTDQRED